MVSLNVKKKRLKLLNANRFGLQESKKTTQNSASSHSYKIQKPISYRASNNKQQVFDVTLSTRENIQLDDFCTRC